MRLDLGFLGFGKEYVCSAYRMPVKKPRGKALPEEQRLLNQQQARERVVVEHALGGLKRYRILSDRLRMHDLDRYNDIVGLCAGLWNFYIST